MYFFQIMFLTAQVPISKRMYKKAVAYLHNEIRFGSKKEIPFPTAWMDLENIILSEISQSEKDKYHMITLIWGI